MKTKQTARFRVALGQAGLLVSLVLVAVLLGLVPDRHGAVRQGRAALAEALAMGISTVATRSDIARMRTELGMIVQRNPDLLSASVKRTGGNSVVTIGDHEACWQPILNGYSTESQVLVPIFSGEDQWGQLELRFTPANHMGWLNVFRSQVAPLVLFLAFTGFFVFYFYLGKMLKHLDPSRAIPPRVRSALDTMAEGLLVVDLKGQIVLANSALAEILGQDADSLLGRTAHDFDWKSGDGSPLHLDDAPWTRCLQTGLPERNASVQLLDTQHVPRTFIVNCSPVMSASGKSGGVLISLDDVTQLEEKKVELDKAKEAAERANRTKSEFLANMSHEIRTPMNAILGFTDILRRGYGRGNQDPTKHLNTIHSSGRHLLGLINDILDLSKVESGHLEVERIACAPHQIVQEVVQIMAIKAQEKGISLKMSADGPVPVSIESDPARLRQVITNLVGNAIKFTQNGGVHVVLGMTSGKSPAYRIDVCDSGIGITPEQIERIFDPFSQADSSVTRRFGGTGLGLTISRRFAEALGGGVTVQSEPGNGSVFTVTVDTGPIDRVQWLEPDQLTSGEVRIAEPLASWHFSSGRILVVDDGPENRELATLVLQEAGLEVEEAENGKIGAEMAQAKPFDMVLMDMQMPVMDGYAATRLLRERGLTTPIYAMTAHAMAGFERGCLDAGCTGFLTKPIDINLLLETVAGVLGNGKRTEAKPATGKTPSSSGLGASGQDDSPIESVLPVSIPRFREIVSRFVPRLHQKLDEMEQAWKARDFKVLAEHAHWLKGSGGTVGFAVFTAPAASLERLAREQRHEEIESALAGLRNLAGRLRIPRQTDRTAEKQSPTLIRGGPLSSPIQFPVSATSQEFEQEMS